jgi:hypothetical protein
MSSTIEYCRSCKNNVDIVLFSINPRNNQLYKQCNPCKELDRQYHIRNKERKNQQAKIYYAENKEKLQAQRKEYRNNNKDKILEQNRKRYNTNPQVRLGSSLRRRMRNEMGSGKQYSTLLGCTVNELWDWFNFNFSIDEYLGFNLENYGTVWEIDHVIPCKKFDLNIEDDVKKCFHWTNLAPVTCKHNKKKNGNIIFNDNLRHELRLFIYKRSKLNSLNINNQL